MSSTALQVHTPRAVRTLEERSEPNFGDLLALARELVPTGFLPDHIKNPGQCVAIILTGRELGMPPMRALRSLQIVKGKVIESADSQLARFKSDGGRATFSQLDEDGAVLALRHPNGDEHVESFTREDAKRAGLGEMYQKYPKAMLRSRCITAGLKSIGWEGGTGAYDPEEAAAFVAQAPLSESAQRVADADGVTIPTTIEEAKAFPFPFKRGEPIHGRPLAECSTDMLTSIARWIPEKRKDKDDDSFHADTLAAIRLVLDGRAKDQAALPLDAEQGERIAASKSQGAP